MDMTLPLVLRAEARTAAEGCKQAGKRSVDELDVRLGERPARLATRVRLLDHAVVVVIEPGQLHRSEGAGGTVFHSFGQFSIGEAPNPASPHVSRTYTLMV